MPKAEVRTPASRRSVPRSPGTSISAVQSQDWAAACTSVATALCPRVASPTAQQVAWAAPVSRDPAAAKMHAGVRARSDESLDLHALPGQGVFIVCRVRAASVRVSYSAMMDWLGTNQRRD